MDEPDDFTPLEVTDAETRHMLGLFDAPAFVRRGQELEYGLSRLHERCRRERGAMLEMVRLRLRQWAGVAAGPDDGRGVFSDPIDDLWPLSGAEPPTWASRSAPPRRRRAVARDLAASVERFNRRWARFIAGIDLAPVNRAVDLYNRYYLLEKECSLGSARLAMRHYAPRSHLSAEALMHEHPTLPIPKIAFK